MVDSFVDGRTKIMGLIGRGIGHTLSPRIHNKSIAYFGFNSIYVPLDFAGDFPDRYFFDAMWSTGAIGFNVTVPFKEAAARLFAPEKLSVNTIYRGQAGFLAKSTDGQGFIRGLETLGAKLTDFDAVIFLGYGGAAKALEETFCSKIPDTPLFVLKRSREIPANTSHPKIKFASFTPRDLESTLRSLPNSLVVQTTSAPLHGEDLASFAPALQKCGGGFVDLVYGTPSALLAKAQEMGLPCQDGIPMLIGQALQAQELWWGRSAPYHLIEQELRALWPLKV